MRAVIIFFLVLFAVSSFAAGQKSTRGGTDASSRRPAPTASDPQFGQQRNRDDESEEREERERLKRANKERQAGLQRDTDKLLALATELKQFVDKTNENVLSLEVVRKAEEIEKLAHQVKEKMKQ